jgi:hypothetical protein
MIVHNLAKGRRVLFVAEKMAALKVVYRRLEEIGLGTSALKFIRTRVRRQRFSISLIGPGMPGETLTKSSGLPRQID